MAVNLPHQQYQTEPVKCWGRMKELRRGHFRHTWDAAARGEPVIQGIVEFFLGYFSGIGDFANPSYGPYFTVMMRNPEFATKVFEGAEARGLPRDICSSMRCHLGQLFTGMSFKGPEGQTMHPDMVIQMAGCHSILKTGQLFSQHGDAPYFIMDFPSTDRDEAARAYVKSQLYEGIEWMEQVTGRKYDDEKLIEGVKNEYETGRLLAAVMDLQSNVPAPLDMRQLWSLRLPGVTLRHKAETVDFYKELLDEVRHRVERQISAKGVETARIMMEGLPPFPRIDILRYPTKYGAVVVGGDALFYTGGMWHLQDDGSWKVPPPLSEWRSDIRTREDAFELICDMRLTFGIRPYACDTRPFAVRHEYVWRAKHFGADGVIIHMDRGCRAVQQGMEENKIALDKAGFRTVTYEASQADFRDFNERQIYDTLDAFMESLGLESMAEAPQAEAAEDEPGLHGAGG
ncbi:MAG: 2-hydroxyacyl-CoA dehydratase family protein [Dehalococcoidia bacterium]|nr:2-hydroxyacyl-CoA dehydratase family protein [Dehalococcoidia bacterium]MDP6782487.1 2-hydroxyacyl-CoA dehydratase family protein [Dehalococcoidia bacterium]